MAVLARFVLATFCCACLEFLLIFRVCKADLECLAIVPLADLLAMKFVDNLLADVGSFEPMHSVQTKIFLGTYTLAYLMKPTPRLVPRVSFKTVCPLVTMSG